MRVKVEVMYVGQRRHRADDAGMANGKAEISGDLVIAVHADGGRQEEKGMENEG